MIIQAAAARYILVTRPLHDRYTCALQDSLPDGLKEAIPFLTFVAIVGTVGTRLVRPLHDRYMTVT